MSDQKTPQGGKGGHAMIGRIRQKIKDGTLRELLREAKWVLGYVRRYRAVVAANLLIGVVSTVMSLGTSVASKYLIDAVTGHRAGVIGTAAAAMAGMLVLSIALRSVSARVSARLNVRVQNELQAEVYRSVLGTDWEPLEQFRPGDLLSRLGSDVNTVAGGVTGFAPGLITGLVQFCGALAIILWYDPTMALLALLAVPLSALCSRLLMGRMRAHNRRMKVLSGDMMSFYEDSFNNLTSIKAFDVGEQFAARMLGLQRRYREEYLDYNRFSVRTSAFLSLMGAAVSAGCFGWGVYRLWSGEITYGSLTMFLQLASILSSSFSSLISMVSSAISISTSAGRVMAVTGLPAEQSGEPLPDAPGEVTVEVRGVSFAYQSGESVLENVSFSVAPGELIALTGPSGEGKTTLLRLLLGLVRPKTGTAVLHCGGRCYPLSASTRRAFAYVPQGNSMLAGTIRENLRLTAPDADDDTLYAALRAACADEFVSALPGGLDYAIGSRGKGLSEGQAQRLAIARALLRRAPVLLLDEATSALDPETEEKLLRSLMQSGAVHTCLLVTHRPAAAAVCTRRLRVENGHVREEA